MTQRRRSESWRSRTSHSSGYQNSQARVRLLSKAIERIDLFDVMLFRDAEGRAESTVRASDACHAAKHATANRERTVAFDESGIVKGRLRDVMLSTIKPRLSPA